MSATIRMKATLACSCGISCEVVVVHEPTMQAIEWAITAIEAPPDCPFDIGARSWRWLGCRDCVQKHRDLEKRLGVVR